MLINFINILKEKTLGYITRLRSPLQPEGVYDVGLIVAIFWLFKFASDHTSFLGTFFMWFGVAILVCGFCWEIYLLLIRLLKSTSVGSIILAISSSALVVSFSVVFAEHLINEATLTNPAYFPNSRNIIASFVTPIVLAYIFVFGLIIYYVLFALILFLRLMIRMAIPFFGNKPASDRKFSIEASRLIAAPMLATLISLGLKEISGESDSFLHPVIKYIVVRADHYVHVKCANVSSEERYLMIDENLLSVASKETGMDFSQRACNPE